MKPTLFYVGDPMCSWCYGIAPELEKVRFHFSEIIDFEIIMGGLRPYNKETMTDLKDFLTHHWDTVNQRSGQSFNYCILQDPNITYDTEPPCRATVIVRNSNPDKAFQFFAEVQSIFYQKNKNLHLVESYAPILQKLKIDQAKFTQNFNSPYFKELVKNDFLRSQQLGITKYPSIVLQHGEMHFMITTGFETAAEIIDKIQQVLIKQGVFARSN